MLTTAAESGGQSPIVQIILAIIPAGASIIAAYFGAAQWLRKRKRLRIGNVKDKTEEEVAPEEPLVVAAAVAAAGPPADAITMLLIEGLRADVARERLRADQFFDQKIMDSATIARLLAELADTEARLVECLEKCRKNETDKEALRQEVQQLRDRVTRMRTFVPEGNH